MHGRIEVSSVLGEGTVFRVVLPLAENPEADTQSAGPRSGFGELGGPIDPSQQLTLLYAEDNTVNVELLRHVMQMRPRWQLEVASNGSEAISMALASPPDLLLLDMHLGDMTGLDVADTLSHHAHTMGLLKVALSADVMPDQVRAAKDRGFVEYLTKPLDLHKLLRLLDGFSAHAGAKASASRSASSEDPADADTTVAEAEASAPAQGADTELRADTPPGKH
jgi:CheY-like chemotaxis protein